MQEFVFTSNMNSAFLRFRLRQFEKFIREIPVIYLIILTGILLIAGIALFELSKEPKGALIITAGQIPITIAMLSIFMPMLTPVILFFLIRNYLAACRNLNTYLYAYNPEPGS